MMTGKAAGLFAGAIVLLLFGLATLNSGVIALAIPLLVYLGVGFWQRPAPPQLTASRVLSADRAVAGQPVSITVTVTNAGAPIAEALIEETVLNGLEVIDGDTRVLTPLGAGQSVTLNYTVRGIRGVYRFGAVSAVAGSAVGLFSRRATLAVDNQLLIQPEQTRLRSITIRPPRTRGFAGPIPSRQGGSGVDFLGLREYQLGDRLRWVNWRVTARMMERNAQGVFTNVFEQERLADVGIILDARQTSDLRTEHGALFEHANRAAAALAESFLDAGNRVGLLVYGSGIEGVFPGYGRVQRDRILRALGRATAGHHFVFETLRNLPARFFPAQSQIIFVSPISRDDLPTLMQLRAQGYAVMVVSPDPISFEMQSFKPDPISQNALRLANAERAFLFQQLRRSGLQVVDWDVSRSLDTVLHESLARQPAARQHVRIMQ
jgi:uncharacterized protein (DUF58 family)